jgi:hypothetical protein
MNTSSEERTYDYTHFELVGHVHDDLALVMVGEMKGNAKLFEIRNYLVIYIVISLSSEPNSNLDDLS